MEIHSVYCDGGVMKINPSPFGGTWAYLLLGADDVEIARASGIVTPAEIGMLFVSNNVTELLAAVQAMECLPDCWDGMIYTDSNVTRCRLLNSKPSMKGVPKRLEERMWTQRKRLGLFAVTLLDGHPTKKQLACGIGKRGQPVSRHNVTCDEMCGAESAKAMAAKKTLCNGMVQSNES